MLEMLTFHILHQCVLLKGIKFAFILPVNSIGFSVGNLTSQIYLGCPQGHPPQEYLPVQQSDFNEEAHFASTQLIGPTLKPLLPPQLRKLSQSDSLSQELRVSSDTTVCSLSVTESMACYLVADNTGCLQERTGLPLTIRGPRTKPIKFLFVFFLGSAFYLDCCELLTILLVNFDSHTFCFVHWWLLWTGMQKQEVKKHLE